MTSRQPTKLQGWKGRDASPTCSPSTRAKHGRIWEDYGGKDHHKNAKTIDNSGEAPQLDPRLAKIWIGFAKPMKNVEKPTRDQKSCTFPSKYEREGVELKNGRYFRWIVALTRPKSLFPLLTVSWEKDTGRGGGQGEKWKKKGVCVCLSEDWIKVIPETLFSFFPLNLLGTASRPRGGRMQAKRSVCEGLMHFGFEKQAWAGATHVHEALSQCDLDFWFCWCLAEPTPITCLYCPTIRI